MKEQLFALGSYTQVLPHVPGGCGKGISILSFNEESSEIRVIQTIEDIENPSWLHWSPESGLLYAVSESEEREGVIRCFRKESGGFFRSSSGMAVSGRACCHLLPLPQEKLLFAASYGDGRVSGFSLENGEPDELVFDFKYKGQGKNPVRQEAPHAHQVSFHRATGSIYICDLGCDLVRRHSLEAPEAHEPAALSLPGGWGPRHLVLDPELSAAY
ncbi:MAG: beta-propeller fold lactonase family protein, partial [Spirochaetales bacterium]|nr:beta-propeller fold lactonase family protein [Spirochaetales bacterium]